MQRGQLSARFLRGAGAAAVLLALLAAPVRGAQIAPMGAAVGGPAQTASVGDPVYIPDLTRLLPAANDKQALSSSLQILVLMTVLTLAPSLVMMMTCFVRMLIVLSLLRQALGTQTLPPSQVLVALSLFLTLLAMGPTWESIRSEALAPYLDDRIDQVQAIRIAGGHMREFMFRQIEASGDEQDVYMMYEYAAQTSVPETQTLVREQVPTTALIPAFLLSELRTAFLIGFRIFLPFLVIDMVIATILVSMGMMMLPPVLVSLPFKLLLFVLADGWHLVGGALLSSVV